MAPVSKLPALKPTTVAGCLVSFELAAIAPSTVPIAIAGLREIVHRPAPLKVGRLPPVPHRDGPFEQRRRKADRTGIVLRKPGTARVLTWQI